MSAPHIVPVVAKNIGPPLSAMRYLYVLSIFADWNVIAHFLVYLLNANLSLSLPDWADMNPVRDLVWLDMKIYEMGFCAVCDETNCLS